MPDSPKPVTIDADDPLLVHFAMQHDFRERYLHALEQIVAVPISMRPEDEAQEMRRIAGEALDKDEIDEWLAAGRPLPWLEARLGSGPEELRRAVLGMVGLPDA